uniref:Uncharacterized protein n=1 Tax=Panagrolaimus superbus TaxID=310955 RepID=A0A914XVJ6_9BILA
MNRVAALKSKNHELQHQPGASLDKVIDEISSKLALLSGQDCEIEVNIRVKFPNNNKLNDRGNRRSAKASSKAIIQGSRHQEKEEIEKQRPKKIEQLHSQQQQQQQPPPQQSSHHKLRDFAFDIESYAKVDTRDSPSTSEHMPLANAIKRPASPDIITFGGMCNVDSEMAGAVKICCFSFMFYFLMSIKLSFCRSILFNNRFNKSNLSKRCHSLS